MIPTFFDRNRTTKIPCANGGWVYVRPLAGDRFHVTANRRSPEIVHRQNVREVVREIVNSMGGEANSRFEHARAIVNNLTEAGYDPQFYSDFEQGVLRDRDRKQELRQQRYMAVKKMRDEGKTFAEIGQHFNFSPQQARVIFMQGERTAHLHDTPEEKLSVRAGNFISSVLGIDIYQPGWGKIAAERLAGMTASELRRYRNFGPKLYAELRHWAKTHYNVDLPGVEDMTSGGYSPFSILVPKPPNYEI